MQKRNKLPAWIRLAGMAALLAAALLVGGWAQAALAQGKTGSGPGKPTPTPTAPDAAANPDAVYTARAVNGLPDERVWTIAFDGEGRPWVGTYSGGLSVYDKDGWRTYTEEDGLADNDVHAIYFAFDGPVLIGTAHGLSEYDVYDPVTPWRTVTYADGLASSGIEDIAIGRGHVWVTHLAEGVSRFDGVSWTKFTTADGLADNWVHAVTRDAEGRMWFATNGGVSMFDNEVWTTYTAADGLVDNTVFAVASAPDGHMWFGTSAGISEFDGEQWITHLAGQPISEIAISLTGTVWAVGGDAVHRYDGEHWQEVLPAYFGGQDLRTIAVSPMGEVWVGSFGDGITVLTLTSRSLVAGTIWAGTQNGVMALNADEQRRFTTHNGLAGGDVRDILIDQQGRKWFATDRGASMYDGAAWTAYYPSFSSISSNYVYRAAVDPQGRVWFAYEDRGLGLSVKDGDQWRQYTTDDGLTDEHVYSIAFGADGKTFVGTADGVFQLNGTRWAHHGAQYGAPQGKVEALAVAPTGELWAGLTGGVAVYDGRTWTTFGPDEGLTVGSVRAIAFDGEDTVWIGAAPSSPGQKDGGLFVYDGVDWTTVDVNRSQTAYSGSAAQPLGDWINDLAVDTDGRLWVGALRYALSKPVSVVGGVSAYTGDVSGSTAGDVGWTNYTTDNGLISDYVTALAVDTAGRIWVGTRHGLSMFDGKRWRSYTRADGLPNLSVTDVATDPAGGVWVTTWGGGAAYVDGTNAWSYITTVGMADRVVNALAEDAAGGIWFATAGGVSHFDGELWASYTALDGLADNDSRAVVIDGEGNVWVGGGGGKYEGRGLSRFDGEQWTTYPLNGDTTYANVSALAVDPQGRPWAVGWNPQQFTAASALFRFDGEEWVMAAERGPLSDDQVYAAVFDANGALWLGTDGSYGSAPLLLWDGEAWSAYPEVGAGAVFAIALESRANIHGWLGTDLGLARLDMEPGMLYVTYDPALRKTPVQAVALEEAVAP